MLFYDLNLSNILQITIYGIWKLEPKFVEKSATGACKKSEKGEYFLQLSTPRL